MTMPTARHARVKYNERFLTYIEAFAEVGKDSRLFPKKCGTCGREYANFPVYIHKTSPVAHGLEPYKDSGDVLHTMQYRNCGCGSTLCINLTEKDYPFLERLWEMLGREAKERGRPLREIVLEFREQCNQYIEDRLHSARE
jgi:hypothetical protein